MGQERFCENPPALIHSMASNAGQRRDAGLSATMILTKCHRKLVLEQEEDYGEHPKAYWARFRGTGFHEIMEQVGEMPDGIEQERRLYKDIVVDGETFTLSGKFDYVDTERKLILDYKTTDSLNTQPVKYGIAKEGHEEQVNIYRWLMAGGKDADGNDVNFEIERGGIFYLSMKGSKKVSVEIWPLEQTEAYIADQIRPLAAYRKTQELPPVLSDAKGNRPMFPCGWCAVKDICEARDYFDRTTGHKENT